MAARVVIGHLCNPDVTQSASDRAGFNTFGGDEPGALYLTDEELCDLGRTPGGAFTVARARTAGRPGIGAPYYGS